MRIAEETAKLSFANRTKVGAILVKDNRAIA
jgi:deoxycytidylate deaminase